MKKTKLVNIVQKRGRLILLVLGFVLGLWRFVHFVRSVVPLGYDPGLYIATFRDFSKLLRDFDVSRLASWNMHELLLGTMAAIIHKLGVSYERMVRRGIWRASLVPWFVIFAIFRKENKNIWAIAALMYRISITQYEVFYWNYFKQIVWVSLLLLWILFLQRKKWIWLWINFFVIAILHRHTALVSFLVTGISLVLMSIQSKKLLRKGFLTMTIGGVCAVLVYLPLRDKLILWWVEELTGTAGGKWFIGDFMWLQTFVKLSILPILLSLFAFGQKIRKRDFDPVWIWYVLLWIWTIGWFFNYRRGIVFLDLFVILMAISAIATIMKDKWRYKILIRTVLFALVGINSLWYIYYVQTHGEAFISEAEFVSLQELSYQLPQDAIVMVTHRNYTPRVMWYTQRDRIAPGMSALNERGFDQWVSWWKWDGAQKCQMLANDYKSLWRPIFVHIGSYQFTENLEDGYCFELVKEWAGFGVLRVKF